MSKKWLTWQFDQCPKCGADCEVLPEGDNPEVMQDGDPARCSVCHEGGMLSVWEDEIYVQWEEEE